MFKGYATTLRTNTVGYYVKGEVIPIEKELANTCYRMVKPDGTNCLVPPSFITNIIERKDKK